MTTRTDDPISVTDAAARKARQLAEKEGRPDASLRVRVLAGGCSGFTYELSFVDAPEPDDHVVEAADGFRVLVDPISRPIVRGLHARLRRRAHGRRTEDAQPAGQARMRLRRLLRDLARAATTPAVSRHLVGWNSQWNPIDSVRFTVTVALRRARRPDPRWSSSVKLCSTAPAFVTSIVVSPMDVDRRRIEREVRRGDGRRRRHRCHAIVTPHRATSVSTSPSQHGPTRVHPTSPVRRTWADA